MNSLANIRENAAKILAHYVDPKRHYAFRTYDVAPLPRDGGLRPEDILAANLLSLRLGWNQVIPLFADGDGPDQKLRSALDAALIAMRSAKALEDIKSDDELAKVYVTLAAANEATREVKQWTPTTVSKVLHRFAPHAVPLVDSRVRDFYGVQRGDGAKLRLLLWQDVRENIDWLRPLAATCQTLDNRPLTVLRLTDILIWTPWPPPPEAN